MKIVVDKESFSSAIQWATQLLDTKNDKSYVSLVVKNGNGVLSHINASSIASAPFRILEFSLDEEEKKESFSFALSGTYLQRFAKVLPNVNDEVLILEKDSRENTDLLRANDSEGNNTFTIPLFTFQVSSLPEITGFCSVKDHDLFTSLKNLTSICDTKNGGSMPILECITMTFNPDDEKIILMSTDRYSLGEVTIPFKKKSGFDSFIEKTTHLFIPCGFSGSVSPVEKTSSIIDLVYDDSTMKFGYVFEDGRVLMHSLALVDQPLFYKKNKDDVLENTEGYCILPLKETKRVVNAIMNLAWGETEVFFTVKNSGIIVHDAERKNNMDIPASGVHLPDGVKEIVFPFVHHVIQESLIPITSDNVYFGFKDNVSPISLRNTTDNGEPDNNCFVLAVPVVKPNAQ